ncbi:EamA family transporter RarD [Candidatus Neomarinimicrobiota bacterium]
MNRGVILALSAYIFWGVHPIYWKLLKHVPSIEILSHRILWSFVFFVIIISLHKEWNGLKKKLKNNKLIVILPAFLIGSNWALFVWAVNADYIVETSLGYFICPLISVFLGVFFLKETLRKMQWLAVLIAAIGVLIMTFFYGQFPWIALYLAGSWGLYGLLRKKSPFDAVEGLTIETALLSIPIIIYLTYLEINGTSSFFVKVQTSSLLIGTGIISGLPLIIYIIGARLINLSLIGILQYVYPIMILLIGVMIYNEPLTESRIVGFIFIWIAVIVYIADEIRFRKNGAVLSSLNK